MADQSDVSNAYVALIDGLIYPNGDDSPSSIGLDVKIYAGWPDPATVRADMAAIPSTSHVNVYPRADEQNTTRYIGERWFKDSLPAPTLTLTATENGDGSNLVTVAGTVRTVMPGCAPAPQNLAIFVNGIPYIYQVQASDTLITIASALAALIAAAIPGTEATQAAIWIPPGARLGALRVGVTGTAMRELGRQEKVWQIGIWAATPETRDKLAKAVDGLLRGTFWLTLADQTRGRNIYRSSHQSDDLQRDGAYRRDLLYSVEYATTDTQPAPQIVAQRTDITAATDGSAGAPAPIASTYS